LQLPTELQIAIIDDSEDYLQFIHTALRRLAEKVEVICLPNPSEAKTRLPISHVRLVLCDINFDPANERDRQGLELLKWLKENLSGVPVVMMTRYVDQGFREEAMTLGADGFLEKPILLSQLKELAEKYLSHE
jgi:DNA-binding NtrC family response regulator